MEKKRCLYCDKVFETKVKHKKHCSDGCRRKYKDRTRRPKVPQEEKKCKNDNCEIIFTGNKVQKYCSNECFRAFYYKKTGRAFGAPTHYKEQYCLDVIEHMRDGSSLASFAASIGTHRDVLLQWRTKHKEFNSACNAGIELAIEWWERKATECALGEYVEYNSEGKQIGKRPNSGMLQFIMRQRFYRDYNKQPVQEIDINVKPKVTYKTSMSKDGRMIQDVIDDVLKEEGLKE